MVRPLAFGYLRVQPGDSVEVHTGLVEDIRRFADDEGLTLAEVYTDPYDAPDERQGRSAFCALMDALRRSDAEAVIVLSPGHLSRQPYGYRMRTTIIEVEAGARLLVIHPEGERR